MKMRFGVQQGELVGHEVNDVGEMERALQIKLLLYYSTIPDGFRFGGGARDGGRLMCSVTRNII